MIEPLIEEIIRKIVEAFQPRRIVMFGSRARGDTRPDSDLDLMYRNSLVRIIESEGKVLYEQPR